VKSWNYILYVGLFLVAASVPLFAGAYWMHTAQIILIYLALALSWDMLMRAGQISFGIAGLFGIGGYATAILQVYTGINPLIAILFGTVVTGIFALLIGLATLQLRGMYFAIVTLALAEIFRVIIRNMPDYMTGGTVGIVLPSSIFNGDASKTYWLMLVIVIITVVVSEIFSRSRVNFAVTAIRDDEIVARSTGIDIFKYLVFVFVVTSMIQGLTGAAYSEIYAYVNPEASFSVDFSLLPLAMALFGGMYSTWGPVIGAVVLGAASEFLKLLIPYGYLIVYGVIIVIVILLLPSGIMGIIKKIFDSNK
jgi:branched-chain amino acid transport system permease protein